MTDDPALKALQEALKAAPPSDGAAKARALARAMAAFEEFEPEAQENRATNRPIPDRARNAGLVKGVIAMLSTLRLKPMLAATTSAAALGLVVFAVLPQVRLGDIDAPARLQEAAPQQEKAAAPEAASGAARKASPETAAPPAAPPAEEMADMALSAEAAPEAAPAFAPLPEVGLPEALPDTEAYANAPENPVRVTLEDPVSTFSVDVDTASYAVVRSSLNAGVLPVAEAVRVEEMVNYFPYDYPAPTAGETPFRPSLSVFPTPWNPETRLVRIAVQGRLPDIEARPPLNLVLLIDTSGSMEDPNKLPLLKRALGLMLGQLRPEDQVAIVAYAGAAGEVLPPTRAAERDTILAAMNRLAAGGGTAGAEGLELAYRIAEGMTGTGELGRILLATDGDFNLGISDPQGLEDYVARKREGGIFLSVLGFGRGNLDDATMQALAQNGNGTASYIDTLQEARKVLVDQLSGALFPIANDVKIQVEWNPAKVAEYRLIGYETRALRREDFKNDRVDAGDIGAGHQVTALYEITPPGSPALLHDPLRYGAASDAAPHAADGGELGFLRLRFKRPGEAASTLIEAPIEDRDSVDTDARFAAAIAGFGQLLRGSVYLGNWGWDEAIALADAGRGRDEFGYRVEAVNLMRLARDLARE